MGRNSGGFSLHSSPCCEQTVFREPSVMALGQQGLTQDGGCLDQTAAKKWGWERG